MRTVPPAGTCRRRRSANTGSSTAPTVPERRRPSFTATASPISLPRPRQRAVVAHELGAILREHHVVAVGRHAARQMGGGPHRAALDVAQEEVAAPIVARRVLAPAGHGMVLPLAVARSRRRQHYRIAAVR